MRHAGKDIIAYIFAAIGLTYILLPVNYVGRIRRMRKEIEFREDRLRQKQESALKTDNES
jgi:hypothetical protein